MTLKLTLTAIAALLFLNGCGDEKSTGQKMAEAVSTLRGDKPVEQEPIKEVSSDVKTEEVALTTETAVPKVEEKVKEEPALAEKAKTSLKEIAKKATEKIKEIAEPATDVVDNVKDVASVATESAKEVATEAKEAAVSKIAAATAAVTSVVAPAVSSAKEEISEQVSSVTDMISMEKGDIAKGHKLYLKKMKRACGMNGAKFATQHTQQEWVDIKTAGTFAEEAKKICPNLKEVKEKWILDIWEFSHEYAKDSGNIPSCQ